MSFFPRFAVKTPPDIGRIIDALAMRIGGSRYDSVAGILRAESAGCRLRPGVAEVTTDRLRDPHVRFFVEANPGHAEGDELCCMARVTLTNFTPAAFRAMGPEPRVESMLI